ncbi:hypothetical protein, partial [Nostoc sp. 'Peltigera membranacea cyanobiont' 232]|uniref:hypothetical protein n=1 Tax=Nostoc sp. 'Peltigera membranacea cyanobiont' 232 TaxID=2014531 RepID=UPI001CB93FE5
MATKVIQRQLPHPVAAQSMLSHGKEVSQFHTRLLRTSLARISHHTSQSPCLCRGAGEQGSRGENKNTKFFPLCPSAPLLYQTPEACEKCG